VFATRFLTPTKTIPKQGLLGFVRMDDNVIELFGRKSEEKVDPVLDFVQEHLIPWAIDNRLDINSMKFKLNGATIMTCLQGMLLDDI
jgi:hypothetical protein